MKNFFFTLNRKLDSLILDNIETPQPHPISTIRLFECW